MSIKKAFTPAAFSLLFVCCVLLTFTMTPALAEDPQAEQPQLADESELVTLTKASVWKDHFMGAPFEVTKCTVNWVEKTPSSWAGTFTATLKTTENFYRQTDLPTALEKMGIAHQYLGELHVAAGKVRELPEPYRSNLASIQPKGDYQNHRFFEVIRPAGSEEIVQGSVDMKRKNNRWEVSTKLRSRPEYKTTASDLLLIERIDVPETIAWVKDITAKRKAFIEKVNTVIEERQRDHQAAMDAQRATILRFCQPGKVYEGAVKHGDTAGHAAIVFGEFQADDTAIMGYVYHPAVPEAKREFVVRLDPANLEDFPVNGKLSSVPKYKAPTESVGRAMGEFMYGHRDNISIRFEGDTLLVNIHGRGWGTAYLTLKGVTPPPQAE